MIAYLFQVTVCLSAFYLLYLCVFSRETFFGINRSYLLGTLMLSLVLPLLTFLPELITPNQEYVFHYALEPVVVGFQDVSMPLAASATTPVWVVILLWLYWIGVAVFLWKFFMSLYAIRKIYREGEKTSRFGIHDIVSSQQVPLPFSFMHWIFLPAHHRFTDEELQEILTHESAHARAWHSVDILCIELACIFLWPSPVIYFYRKSLRRVHEYLADAAVLRHASLRQYGELLLSHAVPRMHVALAHPFFHSQLKHRILMMTKDKSRRISILKYATLLPIGALVIALFAFRQSNALPADALSEISTDSIPAREIFKIVEVMPRFPGCENTGLSASETEQCAQKLMLEHIYQNIKYPAAAREAGIQGRSVVQFVVRNDGSITDVNIVRSIGHGTDDEVLRVVNAMPRWRPGFQRGEAVDVQFTLPVQFKLGNEERTSPGEGKAYRIVEEMPRFPGCETTGLPNDELYQCASEKLIVFIQERMQYPESAKKAAIEGKSVVHFVVRADGSVTDVKIVRSIGYGTDEVVLDIVHAMPKWRPGHQAGKPVDVEMTMPVMFKMSE